MTTLTTLTFPCFCAFFFECESFTAFWATFWEKMPITGEMLKLSKFAGYRAFRPDRPRNLDNFDTFNISPILGPFLGMLRFYCGLGDPIAEGSPKPQ